MLSATHHLARQFSDLLVSRMEGGVVALFQEPEVPSSQQSFQNPLNPLKGTPQSGARIEGIGAVLHILLLANASAIESVFDSDVCAATLRAHGVPYFERQSPFPSRAVPGLMCGELSVLLKKRWFVLSDQ